MSKTYRSKFKASQYTGSRDGAFRSYSGEYLRQLCSLRWCRHPQSHIKAMRGAIIEDTYDAATLDRLFREQLAYLCSDNGYGRSSPSRFSIHVELRAFRSQFRTLKTRLVKGEYGGDEVFTVNRRHWRFARSKSYRDD